MKKILLTAALFLACFGGFAQAQEFKDDVKKLVRMTIDTRSMYTAKMGLTYDLEGEEKEKVTKDYDAIVMEYLGAFESYYLSKYTHAEVKEMISFYESPAGKKIIKDKKDLSNNKFPKGKEWDTKLDEINKKY